MKVVIECNAGTFAAYLGVDGKVEIYEGADDQPVAVLSAPIKRKAVLDRSTEAVANLVLTWLGKEYQRLEVGLVSAFLTPLDR